MTDLPKLLLSQFPDAVIFIDREGRIKYWNAAAEIIFGIPVEEAIGSHLDIIIPEKFRKAHWNGFDNALLAKQTKHKGRPLATKAIHGDGHTIYVEMSFAIIVNEEGESEGALASARNITTRFEKEKLDQKRLLELENQVKNDIK